MYSTRKLWATCFVKKKYFLGAQSNQRSEGLNSRIHKHLDRKMTLYNMVEHFFRCVSRIRRNEYELDCIASQSIPVCTTEYHDLELSAAICFTPAVFQLVRKEIIKASNFEIVEIMDHDDFTKFIVRARVGNKLFDVDCKEDSLTSVSCSCLKLQCDGIPCCHVMVVLIKLGVSIPAFCVLQRWTMNAKSCNDILTQNHEDSLHRARVTELCNLAKQIFEESACSTDEFSKWKKFLEKEVCKKRKNASMEDIASSVGHDSCKMEMEESVNVQDPEQILSGGAPKRLKSFQDQKRTRRCSQCKGTNHDKRNCRMKS